MKKQNICWNRIQKNQEWQNQANDYETVLGKEKKWMAIPVLISPSKKKTSAFRKKCGQLLRLKILKSIRMSTVSTTTKGMYKAPEDNGADGFPVRMKTTERSHNMVIDLVKAESRKILLPCLVWMAIPKINCSCSYTRRRSDERHDSENPEHDSEERQKYMQQMQEQSQPQIIFIYSV